MSRVILKNKKGKEYCLLSPKDKAFKCFLELDKGIKYTNFGVKKLDEDGKPIKLNQRKIGYRQGVIFNYIENTRIWLKKPGNMMRQKIQDIKIKNKE